MYAEKQNIEVKLKKTQTHILKEEFLIAHFFQPFPLPLGANY